MKQCGLNHFCCQLMTQSLAGGLADGLDLSFSLSLCVCLFVCVFVCGWVGEGKCYSAPFLQRWEMATALHS